MTVIAWDGASIAADCQSTMHGMRVRRKKLQLLGDGRVAVGAGDSSDVLAMNVWAQQGFDPTKLPAVQSTSDFVILVVAGPGGCVFYEKGIHPFDVIQPFMAWGAGREFAMGAMAQGATAKEACEIACRFENSCGLGVDVIRVRP